MNGGVFGDRFQGRCGVGGKWLGEEPDSLEKEVLLYQLERYKEKF